jgi:hypothetical protein
MLAFAIFLLIFYTTWKVVEPSAGAYNPERGYSKLQRNKISVVLFAKLNNFSLPLQCRNEEETGSAGEQPVSNNSDTLNK